MIPKRKTHELLTALDAERDEHLLTWEQVADGVGVALRTVMNAMAWHRGEGKHRPGRATLRAIVKWLRRRGVEVAVG